MKKFELGVSGVARPKGLWLKRPPRKRFNLFKQFNYLIKQLIINDRQQLLSLGHTVTIFATIVHD